MTALLRSALLVAVALTSSCTVARDAVWLLGADLAHTEDDLTAGSELLLAPHRVQNGTGQVLLLREYYPGKIWHTDDRSFEKLSIGLESVTAGQIFELPDENVSLYYSTGSVEFSYKGVGFYSTSVKGTLLVKEVRRRSVTLSLDVTIELRGADVFAETKQPIRLSEDIEFELLPIEKLTPWLGLPSDDPFTEASPRGG